MPRVLHIADVHLGASFSAFGEAAEARAAQVMEAFGRLPEFARTEEAHAVVVAGDLFDGRRPPVETVAAVGAAFERLAEDGVPVFVVPGNHDPVTVHPNPYAHPLGGAHVFTAPDFGGPVSVDTAGGPLHAYGLAFDPARQPDPLPGFGRADLEGTHVVLLHGSVPGAPHWQRSPNALRLPLEQLEALDADYIALGDHHRCRAPDDIASAGTFVPACYSGSFAAADLTETGPRGFVVADIQPGQRPAIRHVPSPVPMVEDLGERDVGAYETEVEIAQAVAQSALPGTIPVVRLTGTPGFPLDAEIVRAELRQRFPYAEIFDCTSFYTCHRLDDLARQDTIAGHVVRLGRRRLEEATSADDRAIADQALRIALRALGVMDAIEP